VAVLVLDLPVFAMDVELGALVLADLTPGIDGFLLLVEVAAATGRGLHDVILVSLAWLPPVYLS